MIIPRKKMVEAASVATDNRHVAKNPIPINTDLTLDKTLFDREETLTSIKVPVHQI